MKEYFIIDRKTGKVVMSFTTTTRQACKNYIDKIKEDGVDAHLVLCENLLGV